MQREETQLRRGYGRWSALLLDSPCFNEIPAEMPDPRSSRSRVVKRSVFCPLSANFAAASLPKLYGQIRRAVQGETPPKPLRPVQIKKIPRVNPSHRASIYCSVDTEHHCLAFRFGCTYEPQKRALPICPLAPKTHPCSKKLGKNGSGNETTNP